MSQPVFSTTLEEDLVQRVGTKLHLEVTVEDQSEKVFFEWRGPSGSNADDGRIVITETGNTSTAEITPLHLQDQGIWTCSAKNKHGVTQTKTNVLAQVPKSYKSPVFLEELVAGLTEAGTVSLECKVVGIPSPALRWFRDGDEIRSGDVFALQANMERPVSVYRCDAVNCMGTISSTAVLDISKSLSTQTKSAPILTETLIDKKVKIGELVELSIAVSRVSLPVRVVWWNHGQQIAVGDKYSVVENAEGRYSVIINPVELCDDGEWKVSVENQFGSAASECTLTLRVPKNYRKPRFVENLKAVLTKEGLVSFECKVVGYPTPVLRWFKDGAELKPGDVYQLSGSRSLGTYSCLARNCMGESVSTAALTVEDIGEKFPDSKSELRFLVPLHDAAVKIGDKHRFSIQVTYSPCLEIAWRYKEATVGNNERVTLSKEDGGYYHCDINQALLDDEGEWSVIAKDSGHEIDTKCLLSVTVPKHYKKPRFLEPLKAVLNEEGAVNLECKVIGIPQPTLSWYKDGVELKAGDIHRLMSGKDGSCCLGTYTCVATNCMGSVTSSAALLGFEDAHEQEHAIAHDLQTPDISDGNLKPFSLSTIQEERTSQMMSPEAAQVTETLRQQSIENDDQISVISMGKLDQDGELSLSIGNQEVTLSLYQTPDLSEGDAKNICEMFADELAESITESNYVELPPLRFTKETAKASNICMEAIIIDIDQQDLEEYESMKMALENIDDLQTECDIDDVSLAEWNDDPIRGTEFETMTCEEILELDDVDIKCEQIEVVEHPIENLNTKLEKEQETVLSQINIDNQLNLDSSNVKQFESREVKESESDKGKAVASNVDVEQPSVVLSENKSDAKIAKPTEKISKVVGVQKKSEKTKSKDDTVEFDITWQGTGDSVMVAGDFNNWQPEVMTQGEKGSWSIKKKLQAGKYNLKFVVDGKWIINSNLESITNQDGNINNQIDIQAHGKKQESQAVGIKQSKDEQKQEHVCPEGLELKETDTIKKSKNTKGKKPAKSTEDRDEQISVAVESNDSSSSVTETDNTVLIKDSLDKDQPQETKIRDETKKEVEMIDVKDKADSGKSTTQEKIIETIKPDGGKDNLPKAKKESVKQEDSMLSIDSAKTNILEPEKEVISKEESLPVQKDVKEDARDEKKDRLNIKTNKEEVSVKNNDSSQGNSLQIKNEDSTMEESQLVQKEVKKTVKSDAMKETLPIVEKEREKGDIPVQSKDSLKANELKYENLSVPQELKEIAKADTIEEKLQIVEKESESKNSSQAHSIEHKTEDSNKTETVPKEKEFFSKLEKEIEKEGYPVQSNNNLRADILDPKKEDTIAKKETMVEKNTEKENVQSMDSVQAESLKHKQVEHTTEESQKVQREALSEKECMVEDTSNVTRQKKQSRQESVVDSESIPDIETFDSKDNIFLTQENKDLLSNDDDLDLDEEFEAFKKERRKSSYEETLAGMDPEILRELGLAPETEDGTANTEKLDLSLLPTETAEQRLSRIEEKANKMVIEDDTARTSKSRSRSRSRSKSRPPNLDTVKELKKEEVIEAYKFYGLQPSLDTIKESPSTASMLGVLQGGISSASINTVLQGSASTSELHKDLKEQAKSSPLQKEKGEPKVTMPKDRISEEKDYDETDNKSKILASGLNEQTITDKESKNQDDLGLVKVESAEENKKNVDSQDKDVSDISSKTSKKPKKKAQRSDTKLIKMDNEEESLVPTEIEEGLDDRRKDELPMKEDGEELSKRIEELSCTKSIKDKENNITKDNENKFIEGVQELIQKDEEKVELVNVELEIIEEAIEVNVQNIKKDDVLDDAYKHAEQPFKHTENKENIQFSIGSGKEKEKEMVVGDNKLETKTDEVLKDSKTQDETESGRNNIVEKVETDETHVIPEQKLSANEPDMNIQKESVLMGNSVCQIEPLHNADKKTQEEQVSTQSEEHDEKERILSNKTGSSGLCKFIPGYIEKQDSLETFDIDLVDSLEIQKSLEESKKIHDGKDNKMVKDTSEEEKEEREKSEDQSMAEGKDEKIANKLYQIEAKEKEHSTSAEKEGKAKLAKDKEEEERRKAADDQRSKKKAEDEEKKAEDERTIQIKTEEEKKKASEAKLAKIKAEEEKEAKKAVDEEKAKEIEEQKKAAEDEGRKREEEANEREKAEEEKKKQEKEEELKKKVAEKEDEEKKRAHEEKIQQIKAEEEKRKAFETELAKKKAKEEEDKIKAKEEEIKKQEAAEEENKKVVEEEKAKKKAKEEEDKKRAEEAKIKQIKADEEKRKAADIELAKIKAKEDEDCRKVEEEKLAKMKLKEEEDRQKSAEDERKKRENEEKEKKKAAEEERKKRKAEEEEKKKAAEEERKKHEAEEEEKQKNAEEEKKKREKAEEEKKKAAEHERKRQEEADKEKQRAFEEESAKKKAEEDEKKRVKAEKLAKQRDEEEEERKKAAEEERKRREQEEEEKKKKERDKKDQAQAEEEKKKAAEEELARKQAKQEEDKKVYEMEKQKREKDEEANKKAQEERKQHLKAEEVKKVTAEKELTMNKTKELEKKKAAEEELAKKKAKEEENKKLAELELARKKEQEIKKREKEEEENKKTEEAKRLAYEQEEQMKAKEHESKKREKEDKEKRKAKEQEDKRNANEDELARKKLKEKEEEKKYADDSDIKRRKEGKKFQNEQEAISESNKRKSLSVSEIFEESSSEELITITDDVSVNRDSSRINTARTSQRMSTSKGGTYETNKASSYMQDNITLDKATYQTESYGKYDAESKKRPGVSSHYSNQDSERTGADYSASRYKNVVSPVMDPYKAKDTNESYASSSHRDIYKDYNVTHKPPTPDVHRYDSLSVSKDVRDSRLSPTYDSRSRNISGDVHYRDTVEKSMQTSQNLMSVVTGSLIQKQEQPKTRPASAVSKQATKKVSSEQNKEAAMRKKQELEKNGQAGAVTDIMIKEVGNSWVSLCWKKPSVSRGSPVITYKVESWLCGEGAFWVELGRTPIAQFDAFNLKPDKCYHFRVTARNKRGWGDPIMTTHKVDLSKPTQMPVITSDMDSMIKALKDSPVKLSIQVSGEPAPKVSWQKDSHDVTLIPGVTVVEDDMGSHVEISSINTDTVGKYTATAANLAGRTTKSVLVQSVENIEVYDAYKKFKKWQGLVQSPLAPYMINGPRDRRIQVGQSIQLTCRVVSNPWPVVKWFKEDEPIIADDYTNIYNESDFQHVQVDDVTIDHCGKYCVEAFNEHGSIRSHFTVIVDNGLDRYMPPFFTRELKDTVIMQGCNLLLHCRVESYPYIGVTWHKSGSKIRLKESDYKLIDEDGNVVLVLTDLQRSQNFNCTIMNEIAENSTACQVVVNPTNQPLVQIDEDVIRHSMGPRFVDWPRNQEVVEGATVTVECSVENCSTLIMSRDFLPKSIDTSIIKFSKVGGNMWSAILSDISTESSGLYFITARNSSTEEKYPIVIKVKSNVDLTEVTDCALDDGVGSPRLSSIGPVFARDGDDVIIKTNIQGGQAPFSVSWALNGEDIVWSNRVSPYNRPGCIGIKILRAGIQDEGEYICNVQNSSGQASFSATLLVDYAEQKESELMEELCNCPMLDAITPLMSWSNTPIGTPRRTPLPTPHATPLLTPRATPRTTPRATPRGTPARGTPSLPRRSYGHGDIRSPSRGTNYGDDVMLPPPRKRFVQAPEIFSSFSSKQVEEGASVELKCFISCAPLTQTNWEKDNVPLVSNNQMMLSEKTGVRTLILHNAKLGDSGAYRMTITNTSGVQSCTAILTVKKKNSGSSQYYASSQLSVPRSPYSSLGRSSLGRSSSSYSSYSSYRSYL